jgi:hypothetical protein
MKSKMMLFIIFLWGFTVYAQPVSLTLTQDNLALVKEKRSFLLKKGSNVVVLTNLPLLMEPTSVNFNFKYPSVILREHYFAYDLENTQVMLDKIVGKNIRLLHPELGTLQGKLISARAGMIVIETTDSEFQIISNNADLQFIIEQSVTQQDLVTQPSLFCSVESNSNSEISADVSYLTTGMTWSAEYTAIMDESEKEMFLSSRAILSNYSGKTFKDCNLLLLAGDINRRRPAMRGKVSGAGVQQLDNIMAMTAESDFSEGEDFEYHIYHLERNVSLENQQRKILPLYPRQNTEISKSYNYNYQKDPTGISVMISTQNSAESGLGYPLPKGTIKIYKEYENQLLIVGEDGIDHIPKDETIDLKIGTAFDIVAERKILDRKREGKNNERMKISIDFRNRKNEDIEIVVTEPITRRYEYRILSSNIDVHKKDAKQVEFIVPVKANQTNSLNYNILYTW